MDPQEEGSSENPARIIEQVIELIKSIVRKIGPE
jgi:hypothetical protein